MECAYLVAPGCIELRDVPVPAPGHGEVLVKIERALAGGTDRKAFARGHPQIPMPGPFGHRYAGAVAAVGPGAPPFGVGQPIMGVHSAPCLRCDLCRKERWHLCLQVMEEKVLGAFAQYLLVPAPVARQSLFSRPASLKAEHAALLEPIACVVHGLRVIDWRHVESVLVLGLGVMGLFFAQLLPHYTPARRAGAGRRARRLELARRFGIEPVWEVTPAHQLPDDLSRTRFDVVIECTGKLEGWQQAVDLALPGGQVLLFGGLPKDTMFPVDSYRLHYEEIRLLGDFHFAPHDVAKARDVLLSGALELDAMIDGCLPLAELPEAMRRLEQSEGLQYAIDPW
jgi:L-iditol 2-dehydrogenase